MRFTTLVASAAVFASAAVVGCSSAGDHPPYLGNLPPEAKNFASGPCQEGAEYVCSATLEQANGVLSCWKGVQECVGGAWGACRGELSTEPDPRGPFRQSLSQGPQSKLRTLALSAPVACTNNPCDPGCRIFDEDPPDITPPPGGEPPSVVDWSNPGGVASCVHGLCAEGDALDATCHPCVATVCAEEPSCCSGAWTEECVALVRAECAAAPPPVSVSVCDFAVFSETTFTTNGGNIVGGPVGAGDTGANAVRLNNISVSEVITPGSVFLDNTSVAGDVRAGGSITKQNTVSIGGDELSGVTIEPPELPTKDITCLTESGSVDVGSSTLTFDPGETRRITINNNAGRAILSGPGNYAYVHFDSPGTLVLAQPGTYTFNRMWFGGNAPRLLVPPTGEVNIDVCTDLHFDNGAQVYTWDEPDYAATTVRPDPLALVWYTNDTELKIGPGALASGVLLAPHATVHGYSGGTIEGLIYGKSFFGEPGFSLDSSSLTGEACRDRNIDGPPPCPVSLDIPAMPPSRNEPCWSGLDCQINSRCTEVATSDTCDHSKCLEGAPLSAACDPCVQRICEAEPACCTGAWSASCVAKVKTVCDAFCGALTGCAHGVCTAGGPLASGCSTCATTVCSTPGREYCCSTSWDSACVASAQTLCGGGPPSPEINACEYSVMGSGAVVGYATTVRGGHVGGGTGASAIYEVWGTRSRIEGNLYSQGSMYLSASDVIGNVAVAGAFTNTGTVSGTISGSPPNHPIPTKTFACPTGGTNQNINSSQTLAPGTYGDVTVNGWGSTTLTLQAGTYHVGSLTLGGGTRLQMPASGTVIINACGRVRFEQQTQVLGLASGADSLRLQIYSVATGADTANCSVNAICIEQGAVVRGIFSAPAGGGFVGQNATLYGQLRTNRVALREHSLVDAGGSTGAVCRAAMVPCTVTTPPPTVEEGGACVENAAGFTDGACVTPDLAVGLPCGPEVPVCNHGTAAAPAGAELTFYPRTGQQFATESPSPAWAVGTCTVTSPIPAGECVTQSCDSGLFTEDLTIMVNADGASAECSALDNWSMYEFGTCGPPGREVVAEVYEAICPEGTSGRWSLLGWDATTPGGSFVRWSARTAFTEAELAGAFTHVGTAHSTPTDTQECPVESGGVGQCPVDLTKALWGVDGLRNQPAFLELLVEVEAVGTDIPTLHDWKVTYSCVFDE